MGYDLTPKNKAIDEISFGAFIWPVILKETGAGHIVGYGDNVKPGSYVYQPRGQASPLSNDGYRVTAKEAQAMAMCAKGFLSVANFLTREWNKYDAHTKAQMEEATDYKGRLLYRHEYSEKFLAQVKRFAEFAEASRGFSIN